MNTAPNNGGRTKWRRSDVIAAIRRWSACYGAPPAAGEWNPSMARRLGHNERVERFYEQRWPNYRTVVKIFGGWNEAIRAAGLEPRPRGGRPGQSRATVVASNTETDEVADRCLRKGISSEAEAVPGMSGAASLLQRLIQGS